MTLCRQFAAAVLLVALTLCMQCAGVATLIQWLRTVGVRDLRKLPISSAAAMVMQTTIAIAVAPVGATGEHDGSADVRDIGESAVCADYKAGR